VDADVVEQAEGLRPTDFSTFYRRSWIEIYRPLVATIRDPDLAAEAVDEAMERAWARWPSPGVHPDEGSTPSPRQVESLSRMVNQHPLAPELADLLLETERLPGFEHTFLTTLGRLVRVRGAQPEMVLTVDDLSRIEQPNLFIWGADDPFAPVETIHSRQVR
jgi:pimeloyl-ACP methyl ester carboxylesterase